MTQAYERRFRQYPGPAVEQLDDLRTCRDLGRQKLDRGLAQDFDQRRKTSGIAVSPGLYPAKIPAAAAFDHIGGNGPRRPGKADQRGLRPERGTHPAHRIEHRLQARYGVRCLEPRHCSVVGDRFEHRPLAFTKCQFAAESVG